MTSLSSQLKMLFSKEKIFISCFLLFDKYFERFPRSFQEEEQLTAAGGWLKITKIFGTWGIKLVTLSWSVCQNICWGFRQFSGGPPLPPGQCSERPVILDPWRWEGKRACARIVYYALRVGILRASWDLQIKTAVSVNSLTSTVCPLLTSIFPTSPMMKSPALAWTLYILCSSLLSKSTLTSLTS